MTEILEGFGENVQRLADRSPWEQQEMDTRWSLYSLPELERTFIRPGVMS